MDRKAKLRTKRVCAQVKHAQETAIQESDVLMNTIDRLVRHIADLMQEVHGGEWRARVDRESQAIFIVRHFPADDHITKATLREAV